MRRPHHVLGRPALVAGLLALAALPAGADGKVRGLVIDNGVVQFNGIETAPVERKVPVMNGGYPLHGRSTSAMILKPQSRREVIVEMKQRYDRPAIPTPRPPCGPSSCSK